MRLLLLTALLLPIAAPPNTDLNGAEHHWWECQHRNDDSHMSCCSMADGHVLSDQQWRIVGNGYEVSVGGKWWPVPAQAVIDSRCGPEPQTATASAAKVWYAPEWGLDGQLAQLVIYCFMPGTMY